MKYRLIKELIDLAEVYEQHAAGDQETNLDDFLVWAAQQRGVRKDTPEPHWEGKENGRSADSVINTLIVHMNRFAKSYSKSAIWGSAFSSQEDFIYLINLQSFGAMSKMELIKKNVHEKTTGMQIINRLINQGWVQQTTDSKDKRAKLISITEKGLAALAEQMHKIRTATSIVTGNLTYTEKMQLIRLLNKLEDFHLHIYDKNHSPEMLLELALEYKQQNP